MLMRLLPVVLEGAAQTQFGISQRIWEGWGIRFTPNEIGGSIYRINADETYRYSISAPHCAKKGDEKRYHLVDKKLGATPEQLFHIEPQLEWREDYIKNYKSRTNDIREAARNLTMEEEFAKEMEKMFSDLVGNFRQRRRG
jgi:hypothetical protein